MAAASLTAGRTFSPGKGWAGILANSDKKEAPLRRYASLAVALAASVIMTVGPAHPADLGGPAAPPQKIIKAPPQPEAQLPVVPHHISCYVQGLGGANVSTFGTNSGDRLSISASGYSAAGGLGCDWRHERFVLGLLGRYERSIGADDAIKLDHAWTAALRAGYLVNPGTLAYALLGGTQATFREDITRQQGRGFVTGAGLELDIGHGVSLTTEYNYTRLGTWHDSGVSIDPASHAVRLGLTYRWAGSLFDK